MAGMSDSVPIRFPYRNLNKELEVEMTDDPHFRIDLNSSPNSPSASSSSPASRVLNGNANLSSPIHAGSKDCSLITLVLSCTVAAGVQFGWALQLSLLTPYIQVQPCVGIWSDKCTSKYGRRRPFILAGALMISLAVIIIGFSADIGYLLGDTKEHCSTFKGTRTRAAFVFVIGFWMLDLANNTVQGPARALLADLSGPDQHNSSNAIFCSWMAVGNILGFSAGASGSWHRWFPFLESRACCEACANLKAAFLVAVVFLLFCTVVTVCFAKEVPLPLPADQPTRLSDSAPLLDGSTQKGFQHSKSKADASIVPNDNRNIAENGYEWVSNSKLANSKDNNAQNEDFSDWPGAVLVNLLTSLRHLPPAMHSVLIVMALSWLSWFPFFLFDTDWMGREVYHGDPKGNASEIKLYDQGVREGAFGLLLNSCLFKEIVVFLLIYLCCSAQITYSVPFSVTAELTADSGGGQGLAIGVLNLAIVIPQMIVSLGAGPWDALFGGGNIPAFILASFCALAAGIIATLRLPDLASSFKSSGFHFG
ncbi:sucrose transport protein SUC3-like [Gossypium australe]|uniref:Sucrose transport protein SUC3-like n=1 Tax=Gossypium australe TaxID=47621 RepID=A0A5B6WSN2_9ROSI|nr:sucrose transport protein SUC3-like [Gossypium australe]